MRPTKARQRHLLKSDPLRRMAINEYWQRLRADDVRNSPFYVGLTAAPQRSVVPRSYRF